MTTMNMYDCTLADHSNDDETALQWANGFGLDNVETSEQTVSTAAWREVGLADGDTTRVWHDGCESYCFEALEADGDEPGPSDDDCLEAALERLGVDDGCRDYVIYTADELGGKSVKVERDDVIELGRRIIAADAAREIDPDSAEASHPYSRWCGDTDSRVLGETPDDFEPEITLAAGDIVVRMQYRDGGGMDCRGDYRYEITANGETWYDDGLQSPRGGFNHAADSEDAFRLMACSMLSFAATDDLSAEYRAPGSMQYALEEANCEVSEPEDGSDKPSGWTVVDSSEMEGAARALIAWKIANGMDATEAANLEKTAHGDNEYEIDGETWLVLDDSEADSAATERVWDSVWAFNTSFLAAHVAGGHDVAESTESFRADRCEDANDATQALIVAGSGKDYFCEDAIKADGRGHFLAGYDNEEQEQDGPDGVAYYLYRTN